MNTCNELHCAIVAGGHAQGARPRPKSTFELVGLKRLWGDGGAFVWMLGWMWAAMVALGFVPSAAQAQLVLGAAASQPRLEFVHDAATDTARTPALHARLAVHAPQGVQAGRSVWLALVLDHADGWHTYWTNPGEVGLPTELTWTLPAGWRLSSPLFGPAPHTLATDGMMSYAHEGRAVWLARAVVDSAAAADAALELSAHWLACRTECIPESAQLRLTMAQALAHDDADNAALFAQAASAVPAPLDGAAGSLAMDGGEHARLLLEGLPQPWQGRVLQVWPAQPQIFATTPPVVRTQAWQGATWHAPLALSALREGNAEAVAFVVAPLEKTAPAFNATQGHASPPARAVRVVARWTGDAPAWQGATAQLPPELARALGREVASQGANGAEAQSGQTGQQGLTSSENGLSTSRPQKAPDAQTQPQAAHDEAEAWAALRELATKKSATPLGAEKTGVQTDWGVGDDFVALENADLHADLKGTADNQKENPAAISGDLKSVAPENPADFDFQKWVAIFLGAMLGGAILNLMPCVFPVLAIKVLAFAAHGTDVGAQRRHALAYAAGVVASFVALGAVMLAVRAAGEHVGWGFQLQNPWVVLALGALFVVIALNLLGVFEFDVVLPQRLAGWRGASAGWDAFGSGVLAVAVAAPCTAPFMGASLGVAAVLPAPVALAVFAALGVGMALPYVALAWWPAVARNLPRPGAWMQTFKHAMAFPMLAAALWLAWVLGQLAGVDAMARALLAWLALAALLAAWVRLERSWRVGVGVALAALLGWLVAGAQWDRADGQATHMQPTAASATSPAQGTQGIVWQPWSAQAQEAALAAGRTVFVDYTAAWCITCQFNKRGVLASAEVAQAFAAADVVALRADWTARDAAITAELARLGRAGVPTYAVLRAQAAPVVLAELPTAAAIEEAVAR